MKLKRELVKWKIELKKLCRIQIGGQIYEKYKEEIKRNGG